MLVSRGCSSMPISTGPLETGRSDRADFFGQSVTGRLVASLALQGVRVLLDAGDVELGKQCVRRCSPCGMCSKLSTSPSPCSESIWDCRRVGIALGIARRQVGSA